jgi:hypothetical protein
MRKQTLAMFASVLVMAVWFGALSSATDAPSSQYVGTWSGTWEGGGSGKFDLTFVSGSDGQMTGSVNVGTDGGDYTAKFTSLSFTGSKMTGKYTYPLDEQGEIALTATFDGNKATGTWVLGAKGQDGAAMANGTWVVTKK